METKSLYLKDTSDHIHNRYATAKKTVPSYNWLTKIIINFNILKQNKMTNFIGLDKEKSKVLSEKLNELLADYSIFYQNIRGYHWNITGDKFFELHDKFQELYEDLFIKIDEVAERIKTLGHTPNHQFSVYQKLSKIKESTEVSDGVKDVKNTLESFKVIITLQREILDLSDDANDEGTNALMSDYISELEKLVWMYTAYLK